MFTSRSGSRNGSGFKQHRADDRVHRRISADRERRGQNGSRGEGWLLTHRSQCIDGILPNRFQNGELGHWTSLLTD